jgi:acyl carrier protein
MGPILQWLAVLTGFVVLTVLVTRPFMRREKTIMDRRYESAFSGREPLDAHTFYEKYFRERGVPAYIVIRVREILEDVLDADLSRLSAEDDFGRNLRFAFESDSLADVEIVQMLEDRFHIKIADAEAEKAITIRDIVNVVWDKVREQKP